MILFPTAASRTTSVLLFGCLALFAIAGLRAGDATPTDGAMPKFLVYVAGYNPTVSCFAYDPASGAMQAASTSDAGANPTFVAWNPKRTHLYAVNEVGGGRISAFAIDSKDGALKRINDASSAGQGPCHVAVHQSGKWVFSANYGSGHLGVLPVREDGGVGEPVEIVLAGVNAHMAITDPSGRFLFVPCKGSDYIAQYRFDEKTGHVQPNEPATVATAKGAGPRHLAFHPNGKFAYVINELDSTMTSYAYDGVKGTLAPLGSLSTLPGGSTVKNTTAEVVVSPNGKFVYGSNRGHDSVVIYRVEQSGAKLALVGFENGGGEVKTPRCFTLDAGGAFALVASQKGDVVTTFRVDQNQGTLTKIGSTKVAAGPAFVGVMPAP